MVCDISINLGKLKGFLALPWDQSEFDSEVTIGGIVDVRLRHDNGREKAAQPLVRALYDLARRAGQDPTVHDQILGMTAQFVGFQQLHGALYRTLERSVAEANRVPQLEEALALQRVQAAMRQAETEAALAQERVQAAMRQSELEAARTHYNLSQAELTTTQRQLEALRNSTTWRLMEPLRRVGRLSPRLARLGRAFVTRRSASGRRSARSQEM